MQWNWARFMIQTFAMDAKVWSRIAEAARHPGDDYWPACLNGISASAGDFTRATLSVIETTS
jgi:hypothetical protein